MATLTIYGIESCDTCRQARKFLDRQKADYQYHDLRADGLDMKTLERWAKRLGWEKLLNKRSLTWRKVPETDRSDMDSNKALALMLEQPTLIKRPVIEAGKTVAVGFSEGKLAQFIEKNA